MCLQSGSGDYMSITPLRPSWCYPQINVPMGVEDGRACWAKWVHWTGHGYHKSVHRSNTWCLILWVCDGFTWMRTLRSRTLTRLLFNYWDGLHSRLSVSQKQKIFILVIPVLGFQQDVTVWVGQSELPRGGPRLYFVLLKQGSKKNRSYCDS